MTPLQRIVARCKCGIFITINEHRDYYETAQQMLDGLRGINGDVEYIEPEVLARMIETNTVVHVQAYPDTPIGCYSIYHYDLDSALEWIAAAVESRP